MEEEKLNIKPRSFEITDIANEPDYYEIEKDSEFRIKDLNIVPQMKVMFLMFGVIILFFSLINYGILPALFFILIIGFMMDLMGMFDSLEEFFAESGKPRGGYDNIE
jgi:hypothetical protein